MKYASITMKVDKEAIDWVVKVFTVGGTLALSGGVVGRGSIQIITSSPFFTSTATGTPLVPPLCWTSPWPAFISRFLWSDHVNARLDETPALKVSER